MQASLKRQMEVVIKLLSLNQIKIFKKSTIFWCQLFIVVFKDHFEKNKWKKKVNKTLQM